jgi:hypothetical protein
MAYMIRVFIRSSCTHYKRGTQLSVSLVQHLLKVRLHYQGVCAKVLQGHHLEIVRVVDGRLAAHGGVSSLWWWQRASSLVVNLRDTLHLLGLLITIHIHCIWWGKLGCLLCMVHLNVLIGICQLAVEIMDLLLQELNHGIPLSHDSVILLDLALKLANTSISIPKILGKLLNLLIPCVCHHVVGLSKASGLCKPLTQKSLEMV